MKKFALVLLSAALAVILCVSPIVRVTAVTEEELEAKFSETASHLLSCPVPTVSSIGGEWLVIGLARAGVISEDFAEGYYNNAVSYVQSVGSAKLHRAKSTENSKMILALASLGYDARNIAGYNLLEPLTDFEYIKIQNINGPIWALIAFDSFDYMIPENPDVDAQTTREVLIDEIINSQLENGGWTLSGNNFDADITGMALQSLAPYYGLYESVDEAVDKTLDMLSETQNSNGGFSTYGQETAESSAQILTALTSLGINPMTDSRFIKDGKTVIDSIMSFSVEDGFAHSKKGSYNQMATEQAFIALTSYVRLINEQLPVYQMTDAKGPGDIDGDGVLTILDADYLQRHIARLVTLSGEVLENADVNRNGIISLEDVTLIQRYLARITQ